MRLPFKSGAAATAAKAQQPDPPAIPIVPGAELAAHYRSARVGGDFYDFVMTPSARLLFLLLDIAGKRAEAFDIAAATQEHFRRRGTELFVETEVNESTALTELALDLNRVIMQSAGGVRCSPAFLACYEPGMGTLWYVNAGHTPALLRDQQDITLLESNGLPLGLFSHATHDAQISVLAPGSALLLVSRGVVEARAGGREFGMERLRQSIAWPVKSAEQACTAVLAASEHFVSSSATGKLRLTRGDPYPNDRTVVALARAT